MDTTNYIKRIVLALIFICILFALNNSLIGSIAEKKSKNEFFSKVSTLQLPFITNEGQIKDETVKYYANTLSGTAFITEDGKIVYSLPKIKNENEMRCCIIKESFTKSLEFNIKGEEKVSTKVSYFIGNNPSNWKRNISAYHIVNLGEIYPGISLKLKAYGKNIEKLFYVKPHSNSKIIKAKIDGAISLQVNANGELEVETELGIVKFTKPVGYQEINGTKEFITVDYSVEGNGYSFDVGNYDQTKVLVIDPLLASTFLGGSYSDQAYEITTDDNGNIYVTGTTGSSNFPHTDTPLWKGWYDVFVSKFNSNLNTLLASVFIGGGIPGEHETQANEGANSITLDSNGDVYITGETTSEDFPWYPSENIIDGGYDDRKDVFITKLDGDDLDLLISRCFGTSKDEKGFHIAIDPHGYVFVAGYTNHSLFPTTSGAYDTDYFYWSLTEAFVSKFSSDLETLHASTLLGGEDDSGPNPKTCARSIAIDNDGNVYVAGSTSDRTFPTSYGAYQTKGGSIGAVVGFISKLDNNLQQLLESTFFGKEYVHIMKLALRVGTNYQNVYIVGNTSGLIETTPWAYDKTFNGDHDVFIARFSGDLHSLYASTYLGGSFDQFVGSLAISSDHYIYVTGYTESTDFPTPNGYDTNYNGGDYDAFVSKFDYDLRNLLASTYLGGSDADLALAITINNSGDVYVAGCTASSNFPISNGYDPNYNGGADDAFVTKLDDDLSPGTTPDLYPPTDLIALDGYHNAVPLAWNKPASGSSTLQGYNVYRSNSSGGAYNRIASNITRQYYRDETVSNGRTYYYVVTVVYNNGESDYSDWDNARPENNGYTLASGWTNSTPNMDGVINANEWQQAATTTINYPGKSGTIILYAMNNDSKLFLAVDDQLDRNLDNYDSFGILFDENLNREWPSSSPSGEGLLRISWITGSANNSFQGFHGYWPDNYKGEDLTTPSGVSQDISNSSGNIQYEVSVDLSNSPIIASPGDIIGMLIYAYEGGASEFDGLWPQPTTQLSPMTSGYGWAHGPFSYGDLKLATSHGNLEPPTNLVALNGYQGAVPLAWSEPSENVTSYKIYRSETSGGPYAEIASNITRQYYRDETAENGQTYYYAVTAVYNAGESDYSNKAHANPKAQGYFINSGWADSSPTLDGVINANEWSNAVTINMTSPLASGTVTLYAMNNNNQLFLAIDDQIDKNLSNNDHLKLFFDLNLDREWPISSSTDEGRFSIYYSSGPPSYSVNLYPIWGRWPDNINQENSFHPSGMNQGISILSGNMQYEFSFNLSTSPIKASPGEVIGIQFGVSNWIEHNYDEDGLWPQEIRKLYNISRDYNYNWPYAQFGFGDLKLATSTDKNPILLVTPIVLYFSPIITSKTFQITNIGEGTLNWNVSADKSWIESITPSSGTNNHTVTVKVDRSKLTRPSDFATITVHSNGGEQQISVYISKENLILNGDFSNGDAGWEFSVINPARATGSVVNGEYAVSITNGGTESWYIQLSQEGFLLENSKKYVVSFEAYAANSRNISLAFVKGWAGEWTGYYYISFQLNKTKRKYKFEFTMEHPTDANTKLYFDLGKSTEDVYIDNVIVREKTITGNLVNGDFSNSDENWLTWTFPEASAYGSVQNGEYIMSIDNGGSETYHVQLMQTDLLIENGKNYTVSFDAYAEGPREIRASVGQNSEPWTSYHSLPSLNLTTTRQTFSSSFTMSQSTDSETRLLFDVGLSELDVYFDNITLTVGTTESFTYNFPQQGWYLISLPVTPEDNSLNTLFPTALGAYAYNLNSGNYYSVTSLNPEKGYWLLIPSATSATISGIPLTSYTEHYKPGWHLIGSVNKSTDFADPDDNPNGSIIAAYGWDINTGQYFPVYPPGKGKLEPKHGYWLAVMQACDLTVGAGSIANAKMTASGDVTFFQKRFGAEPPVPPFLADRDVAQPLPISELTARNYPNPFNPETVIEYALPHAGSIQIIIYNVLGQKIRELVNEQKIPGIYRVRWDARDDQGKMASDGIYLYWIMTDGEVRTGKMLLLR